MDLGAAPSRHGPGGAWEGAGGRGPQPWAAPWNGAFCLDPEGAPFEATPQADRCRDLGKHLGPAPHAEGPPAALRCPVPPSRRGAAGPGGGSGQRWLPVHVLRQWQCGHVSDQESYTDSTDGWSSVNCGTLPPPMSKIPADRYRVEGSPAQPPPSTQRRDWARKALGVQNIFGPHRSVRKTKEDKKVSLEAGSGRRAWFLTRSVTDGRRHLRGLLPPARPGWPLGASWHLPWVHSGSGWGPGGRRAGQAAVEGQ